MPGQPVAGDRKARYEVLTAHSAEPRPVNIKLLQIQQLHQGRLSDCPLRPPIVLGCLCLFTAASVMLHELQVSKSRFALFPAG